MHPRAPRFPKRHAHHVSSCWEKGQSVRVRTGTDAGHIGIVLEGVGEFRIVVGLVAADAYGCLGFTKVIKTTPRELEKANLTAFSGVRNVALRACVSLRSTPTTYGGAADGAVQATGLATKLSWLPRTLSLTEIDAESKRMVQGDFNFFMTGGGGGAYSLQAWAQESSTSSDCFMTVSFPIRMSSDDIAVQFSSWNERLPVCKRVLHHVVRQHGNFFSPEQLDTFRNFLVHAHEETISPSDLLDALVALYDSHGDNPGYIFRTRDLIKIASVAELATSFLVAAKVYHHLSTTSDDSRLVPHWLHKAMESYVRVAVSADCSPVHKVAALRVCYQKLKTREAATICLVLSALTEVAQDNIGGDWVPDHLMMPDWVPDHLMVPHKFASLGLLLRSLKKKFRKSGRAIEAMHHIAAATDVPECQARILACLHVGLECAAAPDGDDADHFEYLNGLLRKSHGDWVQRNTCARCGRFSPAERFQCCPCKGESYCSKECQRARWELHRPTCTYQHHDSEMRPFVRVD